MELDAATRNNPTGIRVPVYRDWVAVTERGRQSSSVFSRYPQGPTFLLACIDGCNSNQRRRRRVYWANYHHSAKSERSNQSAGAVSEQQCVKIDYALALALKTEGISDRQ